MSRILIRRALTPHPSAPPRADFGIEAALLIRPDGQWVAEYTVTGDVDAIAWPSPSAPERTDELWRTTCFELFAFEGDAGAYREYNFAPSGRWAAYAFTGYRDGMADRAVERPITMARFRGRAAFCLLVELDAPLPNGRIAMTAVIEEGDGTKSYWSVAHPGEGGPDFHHADCFAVELAALD